MFKLENFVSHSGLNLSWKIECDTLTDEDWLCLAYIANSMVSPFSSVRGIPRGGLKLAKAMLQYVSPTGPALIVDDVCTTGQSFRNFRDGMNYRDALNSKGFVVFSRGEPPPWVTTLFQC